MQKIAIFLNDLMAANERGLAPPQNWTHQSIEIIQSLQQQLDAYKRRTAHLALGLSFISTESTDKITRVMAERTLKDTDNGKG